MFVTRATEELDHHANVTSGDTLLCCDGTPIECFICGENQLKQNYHRYDPNHVTNTSGGGDGKGTNSDNKPKAKAFTTIASNDDWNDDYEDGA